MYTASKQLFEADNIEDFSNQPDRPPLVFLDVYTVVDGNKTFDLYEVCLDTFLDGACEQLEYDCFIQVLAVIDLVLGHLVYFVARCLLHRCGNSMRGEL